MKMPKTNRPTTPTAWPKDFFEKIHIKHPSFKRHPQGDHREINLFEPKESSQVDNEYHASLANPPNKEPNEESLAAMNEDLSKAKHHKSVKSLLKSLNA